MQVMVFEVNLFLPVYKKLMNNWEFLKKKEELLILLTPLLMKTFLTILMLILQIFFVFWVLFLREIQGFVLFFFLGCGLDEHWFIIWFYYFIYYPLVP